MLPFEDTTTLSRLYHVNSEPWENIEAYQGSTYEIEYKQFDSSDSLALPPPADSPLRRLLIQRHSCRRFEPRTLPLGNLSNLLGNAYGISRTDGSLDDGTLCQMRTSPSAGGLFPLEVYVMTQNVEHVPDALHHYNVRDHALEAVKLDVSAPMMEPLLLTYPFIAHANLVFFLSAVFPRTQKKYGPRGYRYILLEAGHVAQNLCLCAVEQGLGSLCMGGFRDAKLNHWLELDGTSEAVVYGIGVGHPVVP